MWVWVRIIGHLSQNFHTSFSSLRGSFFHSHPPLSQLIQMVVSRAFYSKCIERVHTSRLVALGGEGREEVTCGAWHTFQHHSLFLSGHGLSPRYLWWFHGLTVLVREIYYLGGRKWRMFPAPRESWPPHHQSTHAPSSLPFLPHLLKSLYVYNACGIWKNDREGHTKAPEQWLEGRPNFPQSSALQTTFYCKE